MHIKSAPYHLWFTYIGMGAMCAMGAIFIIVSAFEIVPIDPPEDKLLFLGFSIAWTVAVSWLTYLFLKMPTRIDVAGSGNITLRSPVLTTSLEPNQIIKLTCDSDGDWILHHTKGRLDLRYFRYDELKRFLIWAVLANSSVDVPDKLRT